MRRRPRKTWALAATMSGVVAVAALVGPAPEAGARQPAPIDVGAIRKAMATKVPAGVAAALQKAQAGDPKGKHGFSPFVQGLLLKGLQASPTPFGPVIPIGFASPGDALDAVKPEDAQALIVAGARSLTGLIVPPDIKRIRRGRIRVGAGPGPTQPAAPAGTAALPRFDFRSMGVISQVNNQDPCGCCWAFATIGNYEALTALFNGRRLIKFSEQYLLNCTPPDTSNPAILNDCAGGFWGDALDLMKNGVPWVNEADPNDPWAYKGARGPCVGTPSRLFRVSDWEFVDPDPNATIPAVNQIKAALCTYGPIIVGVKGGTFLFSSYTGGVLVENDQSLPDHAVLIIGWDDDAEGSGQGAWLIKNSWGNTWGFNGFGYVAYRTNSIGFQATYAVPVVIQ